MKKAIVIIAACLILSAITVGAQNLSYKTVRIGMDLRMVVSFYDKDGLHMQYFTEPGAGQGPRFLGEEIFKNGEKVFDNYREND